MSYDYGKDLKKRCPFPLGSKEADFLIHAEVQSFMNQFPNLCFGQPIVENLRIEYGKSLFTPTGFIRKSIKAGFRWKWKYDKT